MDLRDFVNQWEGPQDYYHVDQVPKIFSDRGVPHHFYKCDDAILLFFKKDGYSKVYLIFDRFTRDVFRLMQEVSKVETDPLETETKDPRIVKWLVRLKFSITGNNDGSTMLSRGKQDV